MRQDKYVLAKRGITQPYRTFSDTRVPTKRGRWIHLRVRKCLQADTTQTRSPLRKIAASCMHSAAHVPTVRRDRIERRQVWLFGFILMWHHATGMHPCSLPRFMGTRYAWKDSPKPRKPPASRYARPVGVHARLVYN